MTKNTNMKNFILVHGSWQGNYSWFIVKKQLETLGHNVTAVTLPGHGDSPIAAKNITMDSYCTAVAEEISKVNGKVFLVGHSMGGIVISAVAEMIPEKVAAIIYLAAFIPENGQSLNDLRMLNTDSAIEGNILLSLEQGTVDIPKDKALEIFYHDATSHHELAMKMHQPEPIGPLANPVTLTEERYGQIPKHCIYTTNDRAITYAFQQMMASRIVMQSSFSLPCGHMPQLAMPEELVTILNQIATAENH